MTVSKRARFEVLRRDGHACQYCGRLAPDVILHIDHVEPVALGGSDDPSNLVTACKDCNSGKASISPDAPFVQAVGAKAAAYALGMVDKMTRFRNSIQQGDDYVVEFEDNWNAYTYTATGKHAALPDDYELSLHRWFNMGIPSRLVSMAIKRAMTVSNKRGATPEFSYLCGIIWNQINAQEIDYSVNEKSAAVYTKLEADEIRVEGYEAGFEAASAGTYDKGSQDAWTNLWSIVVAVLDGVVTEGELSELVRAEASKRQGEETYF